MNALASDQARRIAGIVHRTPSLHGKVTAGLYVGETGASPRQRMGADHLIENREVLRERPPDILLTNYKMLDLLLTRPVDFPLWRHNAAGVLRYLVVDELHTFDGAQGTDLACLIRRLRARLQAEKLVCVGTSATIGGDEDRSAIVDYVSEVFHQPFAPDAVVGEVRQGIDEFLSDAIISAYLVPQPGLAEWMDPRGYASADAYIRAQHEVFFGEVADGGLESREWRLALGGKLREHASFVNLLRVLDGSRPTPVAAVLERLRRSLPGSSNRDAELCLRALCALISVARRREDPGPDSPLRPLVNLKLHLWVRELRRMVCSVHEIPVRRIRYADDLKPDEDSVHLPLIQCRECHATGWGCVKHAAEQRIGQDLRAFYNRFFLRDVDVNYLFPLAPDEPPPWNVRGRELTVCGRCGCLAGRDATACPACGQDRLTRVFRPDAVSLQGDRQAHASAARPGLSVLRRARSAHHPGRTRVQPARRPTLAQLFVSRHNDDRKVIAFSDNVQDAAHRGSFFAARTWRNGLRAAIAQARREARRHRPRGAAGAGVDMVGPWGREPRRSGGEPRRSGGELRRNGRELRRSGRELRRSGREPRRSGREPRRNGREPRRIRRGTLHQRVHRPGSAVAPGFRSSARQRRGARGVEAALLGAAPGALGHAGGADVRCHHREDAGTHPSRRGGLRPGGAGPCLRGGSGSNSRGVRRAAGNRRSARAQPGAGCAAPDEGSRRRRESVVRRISAQRRQPLRHPRHRLAGLRTTLGVAGCFPRRRRTGTAWRHWRGRASPGTRPGSRRSLTPVNVLAATRNAVDVLHIVLQASIVAGLASEVSARRTKVWALNPARLHVTARTAVMHCEKSGRTLVVPAREARAVAGRPVPRSGGAGPLRQTGTRKSDLGGAAVPEGGHPPHRVGRAHGSGVPAGAGSSPGTVRRSGGPWEPNLLSATPTLELGVDIGDLSTVVMCSAPPAPVNWVQRTGRAGRRDGNALTLTVATGQPHDLYYYTEPMEMLGSRIDPPGVFLNAPAVLERQLTAFCLDCWVAGGVDEGAVPRTIRRGAEQRRTDEHPGLSLPASRLRRGARRRPARTFLSGLRGTFRRRAEGSTGPSSHVPGRAAGVRRRFAPIPR